MRDCFFRAAVSGWAAGLIACAESAIEEPAHDGGYESTGAELDAGGFGTASDPRGSDAVRASDAGRADASRVVAGRDAGSSVSNTGVALDAAAASSDAGAAVPGASSVSDSGPPVPVSPPPADSGAAVQNVDTPVCAAELRQCGSECADVRASTAHCGDCGQACAAGESCSESRCVAPAPLPPPGCSAQSFEGRAYLFCSEVLSWRDARGACIAAGTELAIVESAAENEFVRGNGASWIGASDVDAEGNLRAPLPGVLERSDGAAIAFTAWAVGEPNNQQRCDGVTILDSCFGDTSDEDCVVLQVDGTWNDLQCSRGIAYVCEAP